MKVISHVPGHPKTLEKILVSQYFRYNEISQKKNNLPKSFIFFKNPIGEARTLWSKLRNEGWFILVIPAGDYDECY